MAKLFAAAIALAGVGGAIAMFTVEVSGPPARSSGFVFADPAAPQVHPAWAIAAGFGFLLGGLGLAALVYVLGNRGTQE